MPLKFEFKTKATDTINNSAIPPLKAGLHRLLEAQCCLAILPFEVNV
jgi:hypothetical protein